MPSFFKKLKQLFRLFAVSFGQYKWKILLMTFLTLGSGFLEGIGINAVIPLFSFIDNNQNGGKDLISRAIKTVFSHLNLNYSVRNLLIFIITLFIAKAIVSFIGQYLVIGIVADYENKTRENLLRLTFEGEWPHLVRHKFGYLDQLLITDINYASSVLSRFSAIILVLANLFVYSLIAINISFPAAVLALFFGGLILVFFKPWFDKSRYAAKETASEYKQLAHYVNENIMGLKVIKSMSVENPIFRKGRDFFKHLKKLKIKTELLQQVTGVFLQPIGIIFIVLVFLFFYKTSTFSFAAFAVVVYAINQVFGGVQNLQNEAHTLNSRIPYLLSIINYRQEMLQHKEKESGHELFRFEGRLEFRGTCFSYRDSEEPVLFDINFTVQKGEMIGLIGPSGAGKTTIVDLLLRLFLPTKGEISIDGKNISEISLADWRNNVGYVSQDIFLSNDSIWDNIKFYNESLDKEKIIAAAKMANIYDFIESLPDKFETIVGERGLRLSGGQRQRIVLARILARQPKILILDEATSALDNESETLIQKAIEGLRGRVTVITIAHRLSTVINFDKLLVLESGSIIEEGNPQKLLEDPGSYFYRLYNLKK